MSTHQFIFRQRQLARAIESYRTVLRHDSTYVRAYNNLGNAFLLTGQAGLAVQAFERAIALDPDYAQPRAVLSQLYLQQGRKAEAEEQQTIYRRLVEKEEL